MFDIFSALSGGFALPVPKWYREFFLRVFCGESVVEGSSRKGQSVVVSEQNCGGYACGNACSGERNNSGPTSRIIDVEALFKSGFSTAVENKIGWMVGI